MSHPYPPGDVLPSSLELAFGRHTLDQQHGPYLVAAYLEQIGLSSWTSRVMSFMRIYDGLESWLEPGDVEAVEYVRLLLLRESQRGDDEDSGARRFRLAVAMANSPVAGYGAAFKIQRRHQDHAQSIWWKPLEQSWLSFLAEREKLPDYTRLYVSGPCEFRAPAQSLIEYLMER